MTILIAGATGLVGGLTLAVLLADGHEMLSVGRRPTGVRHPHLGEVSVDFTSLPSLPPATTAICALGTTMAQAGSRAAFHAVDHDAVVAFFEAARTAGADHALLVSAVGADRDAAAYYSRVKGEVEASVKALGFRRLDILRPGLILGPRSDRRPLESLFQGLAPLLNPLMLGGLDRYAAIPASTIATAVASLVGKPASGRFVHDNRGMMRLASERSNGAADVTISD